MSHIVNPGATLGQLIRRARKDAGLSHDKLAEKIGSTRSHLIKLEKGQHRPKPEMLARIAAGTGKSIEFFEDGTPDSDEEEAAERMSLDDFLHRKVERAVERAWADLLAREGAAT